ncbi:MAG TPA: MaoC/PaaZ C-terminal domain-containing protein [Polyangiaceae bacterium]|jgi:acyl dehydratase|nr:MaoC/PaaZ C-terminal domain-containing protein [Polyangiaceae bacterium]
MSLDLSTIGFKTEPHVFTYDWKTVVAYALGIGAKRAELDYLYEGRGPKVFPTFGVIPAYGPVSELFQKTRCDMTRLVHGAQTLRMHRALPPAGTLRSVGAIRGIYDMKKLAQVVLETKTTLNGEPCFDTEWQLLVRDAGNFGGERPPKSEAPKIPEGKAPSFEHSEMTSPEQALLYRLSGDLNPLHADPAFASMAGFEQGPILHGLCTYGFVARAVIQELCGGDASRLKTLSAQFRKPVWPGEAIRTVGYELGDGRVALQAFAGDREDPVITSAFAEI